MAEGLRLGTPSAREPLEGMAENTPDLTWQLWKRKPANAKEQQVPPWGESVGTPELRYPWEHAQPERLEMGWPPSDQRTRDVGTRIVGGGDASTGVLVLCTGTPHGDGETRGT